MLKHIPNAWMGRISAILGNPSLGFVVLVGVLDGCEGMGSKSLLRSVIHTFDSISYLEER
jgi:hypothetical protein